MSHRCPECRGAVRVTKTKRWKCNPCGASGYARVKKRKNPKKRRKKGRKKAAGRCPRKTKEGKRCKHKNPCPVHRRKRKKAAAKRKRKKSAKRNPKGGRCPKKTKLGKRCKHKTPCPSHGRRKRKKRNPVPAYTYSAPTFPNPNPHDAPWW